MTVPEGFDEAKPLRVIDILQVEDDMGDMKDTIESFLDATVAVPKDWREWEGESGTWRTRIQPSTHDPERPKDMVMISASYQGPTMATCRMVVRHGRARIEVTAPMPESIGDDGPAMTAHVREMGESVLEAMRRLKGRRINGRMEHGEDPLPWLLAATILADGCSRREPDRSQEADPPGIVALPTPWAPTGISGDSGWDLRLDPERVAAFDAVAPKALRAQMTSRHPSGLVSGEARINFEALDAIPGESMPSLDDAVALLRAVAMASAAGAFPETLGKDPQ